MSQYNAGNVDLTNGSAAVVGHDTVWTAGHEGKIFRRRGLGTAYVIQSVTDNTHLTLSTVYGGSSENGVNYDIFMDFTANCAFKEVAKGDYDGLWAMTDNMRKIDEILQKEVRFFISGDLSAAAGQGGVWVANFSGVIKKCIAYIKDKGSSGSTIIDVNIEGTSIFDTRPEIDYADSDNRDTGTIDTDHDDFAEGDVITLDIDQIAGGTPDNLTVILFLGK